MKVEVKQQAPAFVPMQMVIGIETEEDARAVYAMFNYGPFAKMLGLEVARVARENIGGQHYVDSGEIARRVTAAEFYYR